MRISYKKYTSEPLTVAIYWKKKNSNYLLFQNAIFRKKKVASDVNMS